VFLHLLFLRVPRGAASAKLSTLPPSTHHVLGQHTIMRCQIPAHKELGTLTTREIYSVSFASTLRPLAAHVSLSSLLHQKPILATLCQNCSPRERSVTLSAASRVGCEHPVLVCIGRDHVHVHIIVRIWRIAHDETE
jgi:hypothetical protein